MTFEGSRPMLRTPANPASGDVGATITSVVVQSVDPSATPPIAICMDSLGRAIPVRMDFQRGKGSIPAPNERWVIDKSLGFWTFNAIQNSDPTGTAAVAGTHVIAGLDDALAEQTAALDDAAARLDEMWTLGTVTAAQNNGSTADVRLSDGTTLAAIPVLGTYVPAVNETVWTARADNAGSRVIVGPSATTTADTYGFKADFATLNVRANTTMLGGLQVTGSIGIGTNAVITGTLGVTGAMTGSTLVLTGRLSSDSLISAGWYAGPSTSSGSPAWMAFNQNVGIVGLNGALFISQYADSSLRADLYAAGIFAAGAISTNGLNTTSLQVGAAGAPAINQIRTVDLTATNNINVLGTFFYKSVAQNMNPASERALKTDIEELNDPFPYLELLRPSRFRYRDTQHFDSREHVGVMVDEMAEGDESTIIYPQAIPRGMADDEDVDRAWANHGRIPDERALIAYLTRAVVLLQQRLKRIEEPPVDAGDSAA